MAKRGRHRILPRWQFGSIAEQLQIDSLETASAPVFLGFERYPGSFRQRWQAGPFNRRDVHENILVAVIRRDESETAIGIEEFQYAILARPRLFRLAILMMGPSAAATVASATAAMVATAIAAATAALIAATIAAALVSTTIAAATMITVAAIAAATATAIAATAAIAASITLTVTATQVWRRATIVRHVVGEFPTPTPAWAAIPLPSAAAEIVVVVAVVTACSHTKKSFSDSRKSNPADWPDRPNVACAFVWEKV
jgi:hypothetical protein